MYGVDDKLLAIFYSLLMLFIAVGIRFMVGTFLIPAGIFALAWFSFTFFPLVILFSVPINSLAILYILAAVFLFSLSALPFNWESGFQKNQMKLLSETAFDSYFLTMTLYFSAITSLLLSAITMLINGFTIEQVIFDPIRTSGQYAAVRGNEGLEYGMMGILSVMFTYLCPLLGGLRIFAPNRVWFFVVSMAPSLFTMLTQSSKLVLLVGLCFYVSGVLVAKIYANKLKLPELSGLLKIVVWGGILFLLTLISFVSRLKEFDLGDLGAVVDPLFFSIASYALGQIYAFADFFSHTISYPASIIFKSEPYSYGAYTFASIFDMLGVGKEFPPGMYDESGLQPNVFETNIFTFFRGLIYDFGIVGSLIFLFVFGIFAHAVTHRFLTKPYAWFTLATYIVIIVFIFMGYLFSIFVARYAFLTALVAWFLLSLNAYLLGYMNCKR